MHAFANLSRQEGNKHERTAHPLLAAPFRTRFAHGDGRTRGVFATRSPNCPNPIGLTAVELVKRDGRFLEVRALDCLDGTPLLDIKPYSAKIDSHPDARIGWLRDEDLKR